MDWKKVGPVNVGVIHFFLNTVGCVFRGHWGPLANFPWIVVSQRRGSIVRLKILLFVLQDYGFVPQTYVLPYDFKLLKRAWDDGNSRQKWILKPVFDSYSHFCVNFYVFFLFVYISFIYKINITRFDGTTQKIKSVKKFLCTINGRCFLKYHSIYLLLKENSEYYSLLVIILKHWQFARLPVISENQLQNFNIAISIIKV